MILVQCRYTCDQCKKDYKAPQLGTTYGEFLLRTAEDELAYLDMIDNPVIDEFKRIFQLCNLPKNMNQSDRIDFFQSLVTICFDKSNKGLKFHIRSKPKCPICKSNANISSWGSQGPPEILDAIIPTITHAEWNKLTEKEKITFTKSAFDEYLWNWLPQEK